MTVQSAAEHLAQLCVEVPLDAKPGHTRLSIRTDLQHAIEVLVPDVASPGQTLVLTKFESIGWQIGLAKFPLPSRIGSAIPRDATPGVTELPIMYKGFQVTSVIVPEQAKPGVDDVEVVRPNDSADPWGVILCQDPDHPEAIRSMAIGATQTALRAPPLSPDIVEDHDSLACYTPDINSSTAIRIFGSAKMDSRLWKTCPQVNPKIVRGKAPPLNVPGILAREDIAEGETIFSIPKDFHVSSLSGETHVPEFYKDVVAERLPQNCAEEGARYALVTRLLHEAEERAEARKENREAICADDWLAKVDPKVRRVWEAYMDQLLSEDFGHHPLRKMGEDPEAMRELLSPSCYTTHLLKEVRRVHTLYREVRKASTQLAGKRFESGMFLRTMLNFQSRQFKAAVSASLVPGSDLLNHAPAEDMSVAWGWQEDIQAHVLKCIRSVSAGQELLQSYGCHANTSFYRCYSFTMPPQKEVTWCYSLWKDDVGAVYAKFIPEDNAANRSEIHLSTSEVSQSLKDVLTDIAKAGGNPAFFLRTVCTVCIRPFEESEKLKLAIESLRLARSANPSTAAWWEHLRGQDAALVDDEIIRIQMSDYLCLVAHLEAISFLAGEVEDCRCLSLTRVFRQRLQTLITDLYRAYQFK